MRILQLAPVWEKVPPVAYGGTEVVVYELTEELVRRGVDVTLCASGDSDTSANFMSFLPRNLRSAGLVDDPLQYGLMHMVLALKEARRFDIVHTHAGPPSEFGMALSHLIDVPMLTTFHNQLTKDTEFIWSNYHGWYNTISQTQYRNLPPLPFAQFAGVAYNAIDVASFPFTEEHDDYLLFVGRITRDKGTHIACQVARDLGMRLKIAGKVGAPEEKEYFKECVEPLIDGDQIEFVGEADGPLKRELYSRAQCLLVPLQWDEPFGLVMIEAMACGTPPIAFARGAAPEIITDGLTGFLVADAAEMAQAVKKIDRISPGACREAVELRFSPAVLADRYLSFYTHIVGDER